MSIGVTSLLSPASDHRLRPLTDALATAGHEAELVDGPWQDRLDAMRQGIVGGGWLCGLLHVELSADGSWPYHAVAAPPSTRDGSRGSPVYFGDVVVSPDSEVRDFDDLRGARFAYNETTSLSGYRMMIDLLASHGSDLSFFSETMASSSHVASMRLVAEGKADCAIIDSTLIDDRADETTTIRRLVSVGPYPAPPLVAGPGFEELLRSAALASGWASVDDDVYSMLRVSP